MTPVDSLFKWRKRQTPATGPCGNAKGVESPDAHFDKA